MNIIFLDIDGVLNSSQTKDRMGRIKGINDEKIFLLQEIVISTHSDIVLSSTWKEYWTPELKSDGVHSWLGCSPKRYGRYLNMKLARFGLEIEDRTYEEHWSLRALGIIDYLQKVNGIENFIILDDEDFRWRMHGLDKNWVDTSENLYITKGLTREIVDKIKRDWEDGVFSNRIGHR